VLKLAEFYADKEFIHLQYCPCDVDNYASVTAMTRDGDRGHFSKFKTVLSLRGKAPQRDFCRFFQGRPEMHALGLGPGRA
jgi:hypothetical protein